MWKSSMRNRGEHCLCPLAVAHLVERGAARLWKPRGGLGTHVPSFLLMAEHLKSKE